jgi:hypothetical protein
VLHLTPLPVHEANEFLKRREFNSSLNRKSEKVIDSGIEVGLIEQVKENGFVLWFRMRSKQ